MKLSDKTITIPLYELMEVQPDGSRKGTMHFTVSDSVVNVKCDGEKVGKVRACFGGGIELSCKQIDSRQIYYIRPQDVWNAFCAAMGHHNLMHVASEPQQE